MSISYPNKYTFLDRYSIIYTYSITKNLLDFKININDSGVKCYGISTLLLPLYLSYFNINYYLHAIFCYFIQQTFIVHQALF